MSVDVGQERWPIEVKKEASPHDPIEHFLTDIMQIPFTDWIENSIADIGREKAPTDIFQPTLRNFFTNTGR